MNKFGYWWRMMAEKSISAFKYLLAVMMIVQGVFTMFLPLTPLDGALGLLYSSRISLVIMGTVFVIAGSILLYGKLKHNRKWTGIGLMCIYLCFLFATIIQAMAFAGVPSAWVGNFLMTMIVGALWLRWKYKTYYINPKYFYDDVFYLSEDTPNKSRDTTFSSRLRRARIRKHIKNNP